MTVRSSTTWPPTAELATLARRDRLTRRLRTVFYDRGYLEVETPLLSADTVVDAWIEPIRAEYLADVHRWGEPQWLFLQTSPEFAMKRLLAQGATALFQLCKAFRNGEVGQRHNPEFTIAEWYRVGDDHHAQMTLTESLTREILCEGQRLLTADRLASRDWDQWTSTPFTRLTYCHAFEQYTGLHPLGASLTELAALAAARGLVPPASLQAGTRDDWLNYLLAELVEPELGRDAPVFLYDYPATQSALALTRLDEEGFAVAERFELYIDGIELCNGYHELSDAAVLRERIAQQNSVRRENGLRELPATARLLDAMEAGLPPSSGVALGWDRLVMLALGRTALAEVLAFPQPRA